MRYLILIVLLTLSLGSLAANIKNIKYIGSLEGVKVYTGDCGYVNAYTDGKAIMICNELQGHVTIASLKYIIYHELGHIKHGDVQRRDSCQTRYGGDTTGYCIMRAQMREMQADDYAINRLIDEGYGTEVCDFLKLFKDDLRGDDEHPPGKDRYNNCMLYMETGIHAPTQNTLGD